MISSKVLDKLSDEQKPSLTTAAKHSETYERGLWDKEVAASRKQATDAGQPSSRSTRAFRTALAPCMTISARIRYAVVAHQDRE